MTQTLFLDLDGVLADFDKTAGAILGTDNTYKFEFVHGNREFWRRLDEVPDLFASFDPMPDAYELWDAVKHLDPVILTALPKTNAASVDQQKRDWVSRHLGPTVRVITCETEDKPKFCRAGDVLVDDRAVNRSAWWAAGGDFILHTDARSTIERLWKMGII